MKILNQRNLVKMDGVEGVKKFGIVASPKMFRLLSDKLYNDKVSAVLRELGTNAYDSHVMAGNGTRPIEIHLPSNFNKEFHIRDYGVGLSPDQIYEIFTNYGASDKEESNDVTGCFGLGSKTPFCYGTRQAQVESWYGGKHYIYSMFLNEDGEPSIALLGEQESTEPNGVKITIQVLTQNLQEFCSKAVDVYRYFQVRPIFTGTIISIPVLEYVLSGTGWKIRKEEKQYGKNFVCKAIMGNVAYPIVLNDHNLTQIQTDLLNTPIDMEFEIGDLDILPSREGLSFDARTKAAILQRLKVIEKEIQDIISKSIDSAKCEWEARKLLIHAKDNVPHSIYDAVVRNGITWNSKTINTGSINIDTSKVKYYKSLRLDGTKLKSTTSGNYISPADNYVFIEDDLDKGGPSRIREYLKQDTTRRALVFEFESQAQRDYVKDTFGILSFVLTSSLPKPVITRSSYTNGIKTKSTSVMKWAPSSKKSDSWIPSTIDLANDSGVYVEFSSWSCKINQDFVHPNTISKLNKLLIDAGKTIPVHIYGVKSGQLKNVGPGFKTYKQYVNDSISSILSSFSLEDVNLASQTYHNLFKYSTKGYKLNWERLTELYNCLTNSHNNYKGEFLSLYEKIEKIVKIYEKKTANESIIRLANELDITVNKGVTSFKMEDIIQAENDIYDKFPLLRDLNYSERYSEICKYIVNV